jgi:hypothetical protein
MNGQKILPAKEIQLIKGQSDRLDLTTLPPGMYFITILSGHERKVLKLVL